MMYKLIALIDGDEVYIGCGTYDYLKALAYQESYRLKYETGYSMIQFYIQMDYTIIEEFSL